MTLIGRVRANGCKDGHPDGQERPVKRFELKIRNDVTARPQDEFDLRVVGHDTDGVGDNRAARARVVEVQGVVPEAAAALLPNDQVFNRGE